MSGTLDKFLSGGGGGGRKRIVAIVSDSTTATITPSSDQYAGVIAQCQSGYESTTLTLTIGGSDPRESATGAPWSSSAIGAGISPAGVTFFSGAKGETLSYSTQSGLRWRCKAVLMEDIQ